LIGSPKGDDEDELQNANHQPIEIPEENCSGLKPEFYVVVSIHHRILGIVGNRPNNRGGKYQPGQIWHLLGVGSKGHGYAPGKSGTKHYLGQVGVPFHKRIAKGYSHSSK
tara:strand:- start:152 stop:481 length:330 start_codon:yes stop_codon:yes gene_type:complete